MEPRRGRLGARTLPCNCGEKRRIKGVLMYLGDKLERKERQSAQKNAPKLPQNLLLHGKIRALEAFKVEF